MVMMVAAAMASSTVMGVSYPSLRRDVGSRSFRLSTTVRSPSIVSVSCRHKICSLASNLEDETKAEEVVVPVEEREQQRRSKGTKVGGESTDWIASGLTRRFGLAGGLAWVGFLAFGVISEQIKTRTEVYLESQGTQDVEVAQEVILPNGIRYVDLRKGGGSSPYKGDLVVVDITGKDRSTGDVFIDTTAKDKKPMAFVFLLKPYAGGVCDGVEFAMESMKAGGIRKVIVPPELGFGETGAKFGDVNIPGGEELEYVVSLQRVSIAPS